jgi:flagellar FliL protein
MVDEKDEKLEEGQAEEPKKKKGKGLLLIIIIAVVAIATGAGLYFFVFSKSGDKPKKEGAKVEEGVTFALDPFVVNLSDPTGTRFLKVSLQLELAGPAVSEKAKTKTPQMRDAIISLLTSKTSDALISPEGKLQLKDEINLRVNQILGENSVKNVYLTDFVMQ